MPAPFRLEMRGITKSFGATRALRGVDLSVRPGEILALVGENGAGKSTLMKVLAGAETPDGGAMRLDGEAYAPRTPQEARERGVAMIYQELSLLPHLSVGENILLGSLPVKGLRLDWQQIDERARRALAQVGRENIRPETPVGKLSISDRQLVEIARALASGSRLFVFDEPTSSLTQPDIEKLFELVRRLRAEGHAIIYISHFLEEVRALADRVIVLRDGESVGEGEVQGTTDGEIVAMMVGREVAELYPRSEHVPGETVLEVQGLRGESGPHWAGLALRRGEVVGIAGLIGAGRTELLRAIFGLDKIVDGTVKLGVFSGAAPPAARWRHGAGFVSEDRKNEGLATALSIGANLTLTNLPFIYSPQKINAAAAAAVCQKLGVRMQGVDQPVGSLSGGNQQKVAFARLLYHDAEVWLLDEPTRGVDVNAKAQIYALIDELALAGKAILLVSSYLPELLGVCDRIAVMNRGVLGEARRVSELTEQEIMSEAIGAVAS